MRKDVFHLRNLHRVGMHTQGLFPKKPIWMLQVTAATAAALPQAGCVCQPCPKCLVKPSPPES